MSLEEALRKSVQDAVDKFIAGSIKAALDGLYSSIQSVSNGMAITRGTMKPVKKKRGPYKKRAAVAVSTKANQPSKSRYLLALEKGSRSVEELKKIFGVTTSTVTSSIAILNKSGKAKIKMVDGKYTILK